MASEIEKAPISITKRHFPNIHHLGDITKVNGGEIPPVHIITFGSPCQNLSNIGIREGLTGSQSSLFYHAIRIIEEMRCATNGTYPVIAVWENVMGAFSSNNRLDFKALLESFANTEIPMPDSEVWANAGMVRGNDVDVAWRLLDAQYWGSPTLAQRRRRIFLVADFGGTRATEILFKARDLQSFFTSCGEGRLPLAITVEYLLKKQGGEYPSSVPFKKDVCEYSQSRFSESIFHFAPI
ncbi:DNA cytosine methyltransferase [Bacillus sp. FSL K6-3431]|uniref:DNA cytosine methyltransferase n=1 Tax=Bacillus sp. FSL K6-3431 TaxID=2921500 RepID=UPI0030FC8EF9